MINKRVMKIVEVLLNQETYITIDRISEQLSVSNKTIRNDLQLVDEWLKDNQLQLVKKTGIRVRIDGPHSQKLRILRCITGRKNPNGQKPITFPARFRNAARYPTWLR